MPPNDERLHFENIGGGELESDFERALETVNRSFDDEELRGLPRKIKVEIEFTDDVSSFMRTKHHVKIELPTVKRTGVAWRRDGHIRTDAMCREDRQMRFPVEDEDGRVVPIDKTNGH